MYYYVSNSVVVLTKDELNEITSWTKYENIVDTFVANRRNKSLLPYFDVYFEIDAYEGEIEISEPEKCSELVWVDINKLPEDMIDFEIDAIKNNLNGIKFTVFDADNEKKLVI